MKKFLLIVVAIFITSLLSKGVAEVKDQNQAGDQASSIPENVYGIFQHSCFDCHSKGGKRMAMSHVNFSEWEKYSQDKKIKKSEDIVRMLKKGAMPPKIFRQAHPDKIPTPDQIDLITQWANSLKEQKQ